jgi:hypothetical protein
MRRSLAYASLGSFRVRNGIERTKRIMIDGDWPNRIVIVVRTQGYVLIAQHGIGSA